MCKAVELTEELMGVYKKMQSTLQSYNDRLSHCDKEQSDILHFIENDKFNACEGYLYAKKLQELRHKRRKIKNEQISLTRMAEVVNLYDNIKNSKDSINKINQTLNKLENKVVNKKYKPTVLKNYDIKSELKLK